MKQSSRRTVFIAAAILGPQAAAWLVYRAVERNREADHEARFSYDVIEPPELVPNLTFENIRGEPVALGAYTHRPVLLHFWATWCAPCREELPMLLEHAASRSASRTLALVLVSLDENWQVIRHYFNGAVPPEVVRDTTREAARILGAKTLPGTLLLLPPGSVIARVRGARDWRTEEARSIVAKLARLEQ